MSIAQTILQQLGGNRFIAMTGSKNFVGGENKLMMTLSRNKSRANRLVITLDPSDTYTVEFHRYAKLEMKSVVKYDFVYADQLQEIFTSVTGLDTKL